jgi:hypothetical protein
LSRTNSVRTTSRHGFLAAALVLSPALADAAVLHTDDFSTLASQDWAGGASPVYQPTGGPAGAGDSFLGISAIGSNLAVRTDAARWTGDYGAIAANAVSVDLMVPVSSAPLDVRVVLFGEATFASRWTSAAAAPAPNDGVWRNYIFSLTEPDLVKVAGLFNYSQIMAGVTRFMLRYDPDPPSASGDVVSGELNIDNVRLFSVQSPIPGDFDGDGDVDAADLNDPVDGWKARFGADLDGADLLVWQQHLGEGQPMSVLAAAAVPEPCGFVLAAAAGLGLCLRYGRYVA